MANKGLQTRIKYRVILPIIILLILSVVLTFLPIYLRADRWLDNYINKLIDIQRNNLVNMSHFVSLSAESSVLQYSLNFALMLSELIYKREETSLP